MAKLPMVTITFGCMIWINWSKRSLQLFISSFSGLRLFSGRQRMVLVMKMSSRVRLIVASSSWRILPEAPQKGMPSLSSVAPGASPMKRILALGLPLPNTTWVRDWHN